jgi:hypothetical protein
MPEDVKQNEHGENNKAPLSDSDRIELLTDKFMKDLNENSRYKIFFEQYNSESIERFKTYYAKEKAELLVYNKHKVELIESSEYMFSNMAWDQLWEIQQRKLFDMQCLWRAKQIDIPEIKVSYDFTIWDNHIKQCPFLTPITQEEFDRYLQYFEVTSYDDIFSNDFNCIGWQNYEDLKAYHFDKKTKFEEDPPAWYEYYEQVTGRFSYYHLPDIKGELEDKYFEAARNRDKDKNTNQAQAPKDNRPSFDYYLPDELQKFSKLFEEYSTQYIRDCCDKYYDIYDDRDLDVATEILHFTDKPIYLNSNLNWRESIIEAANNFTKQKIIEVFPDVYKNYLFRVQNGLGFVNEDKKDVSENNFISYFRNMILDGREILGEPRDFNF